MDITDRIFNENFYQIRSPLVYQEEVLDSNEYIGDCLYFGSHSRLCSGVKI